ncbi:hypothetical protein J2T20_003335 [Paenibacillus wynnii]|nr:hypothetical protein [Paenibacillus wynnii]
MSPVSIERATKEAATFGVEINFGVADFRLLEIDVPMTVLFSLE